MSSGYVTTGEDGAPALDHRLVPIGNASNIDKGLQITKDKVKVLKQLDHGNFGEVSLAILQIEDKQFRVAEKKLINLSTADSATVEHLKRQFEYEYNILSSLGSHPNVISSIGKVVGDLSYLMEFVDGKCLLNVLKDQDKGVALLDGQKAGIAAELCSGVEYIHSKGVLHRDLAARNVMMLMDGNLLGALKIVDFGHARFLGDKEYYQPSNASPFAMAWSAIEGLTDGKSLGFPIRQSDVWSVGVTVYEIFANGVQPYAYELQDISKDTVKEYLKKNMRLNLHDPLEFPAEIASIVLSTWNQDPKERPRIADLKGRFKAYAGQHLATKTAERPRDT